MRTKDIQQSFTKIQNKIIQEFMILDNLSRKKTKNWKHHSGGGGLSCEIIGVNNIEKAAVNFSSITGKRLPDSAIEKKELKGLRDFKATGVSVIIHPINPKAHCAHMNIRFFEAKLNKKNIWWFGGGFDLTPYFINKQDINFWKNSAKDLCERHDKSFYKKFNKSCNDYFYIPHRKESRGIGGIFFDQLNSPCFDSCLNFTLDCADTFIRSYSHLFEKKAKLKYSEKEKAFQLYRRGRYVEFNLLYDRGTLFGLQSGGRTESILMSMPPLVTWNSKYDFKIYENKLLEMFSLARK